MIGAKFYKLSFHYGQNFQIMSKKLDWNTSIDMLALLPKIWLCVLG